MKKILVVGVLAFGIVGGGLEASSEPEARSARMVDWTGCEVSKLGADSRLDSSQVRNYALWLGLKDLSLVDADDISGYQAACEVNSEFRVALRAEDVTQVKAFLDGDHAKALMRFFWCNAPVAPVRGHFPIETFAREIQTLGDAGYNFDFIFPWALPYVAGFLTPLAMAAHLTKVPLVEALLKAGANPDLVVHNGHKAINYIPSYIPGHSAFASIRADVNQIQKMLSPK